jgi:glycosyltransferase involved in cell wall biosynthesis
MRLLFIIGSLNTGGAEKVMLNYVNEICKRKDTEVTLFTISLSGNLLAQLDSKISVEYLYKGNDKISDFPIFIKFGYKIYRRVLKEIYFAIPQLFSLSFPLFRSFDFGLVFVQDLYWFSKTNFGKKKYLWIQNNLNLVRDSRLFADNKFTHKFEKIIAISDGIYQDLTFRLKLSQDFILKINNPIDTNAILKLASDSKVLDTFVFDFDKPFLVSMGRLINQKGFDILLEAFAKLKNKGTIEKLVIVGGGEEYENLICIGNKLGLHFGVDYLITGLMPNPYPILLKSSIFVCSSRFDGLSTSINEAMALGLPIVSTPCDYGPAEILGESEFGIICKDISSGSLATSIEEMILIEKTKPKFKDLSIKRAVDFDVQNLGEKLLLELK